MNKINLYKGFFKRLLDLIVSLIAFIILFPIFLIVAIILGFSNGGKPFFVQERPGKNEKIFKIFKFKTMNDNVDDKGVLLPAEDRLTLLGKLIRKYSLDEIPQLINVINGEMSLVGPRPLLIRYLPHYNSDQRKRHSLKPGITGWAQVNGRNSISWTKKFELDIYYVQNLSFLLDLKIIALTFYKVFKKDGIYNDENNIVPDFNGSN